ncbi:MAG: homocysteine S-methyltransferase family protein [Myxococcota bacterium]
MDPLIVLDGGLATTLQAQGLPPYSPVEPWLLEHPDRIVRAHRAFVEAGAQIVLTTTFRCLPGLRDDWPTLVPRAIELARASGAPEVWASFGPGGGHAEVARLAGPLVDGLVLETFTSPDEALAALDAVRPHVRGPCVVSVVPGAHGHGLDGRPLADPAQDAMRRGADGFGVNCISGPVAVAAVDALPDGIPVWAKPSGDPRAVAASAQREAFRTLAPRVQWLGGCCGTTPDAIRELASLSSRSAG